ncbi:hypothetical protein DOY81_007586 [Sarcophaga bullata]|nr:hypothetical protein DOY81_007586 [Sarcophaga bullata]
MNESKDNFSTPKQTKRLGLRRTSSVLKDGRAKTLASVKKSNLEEIVKTPVCVQKRRHQSDMKINYKHLEQESKSREKYSADTPQTPSVSTAEHLRQAVSTNCRPYRLSLSKKVRERMTKKRLEFHKANEVEKDEMMEVIEDDEPTKSTTKEDLLKQIEMARNELKAREDHAKKVDELRQAITVWQTAFSTALQDLQQKVQPHMELPLLLDKLKIPQEMLKHVRD